MFSIPLIALITLAAWAIKDCIKAKDVAPLVDNWKKYAGCIVAGILYGYLQKVPVFQTLSIIAVIVLVGNSFNEVLAAIGWVYSKFTGKK